MSTNMTDIIETARKASELEGRALFILAILLLGVALGWLVKYTVAQHQALAVRHETVTDQYHKELVALTGQHSQLNAQCAATMEKCAATMDKCVERMNVCATRNSLGGP